MSRRRFVQIFDADRNPYHPSVSPTSPAPRGAEAWVMVGMRDQALHAPELSAKREELGPLQYFCPVLDGARVEGDHASDRGLVR